MNETANNQKSSCWRRGANLENISIALIVLATLQCNVVYGVPVSDPASDWNNNTQSTICETPSCIRSAVKILRSIDRSIDPCDNFYEFACGKYMKNNPFNKVLNANSFTEILGLVQAQIKTVISEPLSQNEPKPFKLVKNFYQSCMNESIIEERGIKPLADLLENFGGWPVVKGDSWSEDSFNWIEVLKKFRISGLDKDIIFASTLDSDFKNTSVRLLQLDQADLGLSREFLVKGNDDKNVRSYHNFMVKNAITFGANSVKANQELEKSLEFEMRLANISLPDEQRRNLTNLYNPKTIKELQELYPYVNWLNFMKAMLPNGIDISENEVVIIYVPEFFERLGEVLNSTSKRTMANYFMWRVVLSKSKALTAELRHHEMQYKKDMHGAVPRDERWKLCILDTTESLPISVGAMYVRKYFSKESKTEAINMVDNIRNAFIDILQNVTWLDDETRNNAVNKAKSIATFMGFPDEFIDNDKLGQYYGNLEIEPDNLLLNTLRLKKFEMDYLFNRFGKPVNKTDWTAHAKSAQVNAFYTLTKNSIEFPAAILQDRLFSVNQPRYMNYGAIGQIIGHEITHGFDDTGRQFDENGNLKEWWDPNTREQFLEKAKCIIEQYGNYTDSETNLRINGITTQGENIADNGGLREAYNAYKNWVNVNGPEDTLPSLNYNQQQLFWIAAGQTWCSISPTQLKSYIINVDKHALHEFRTNGVVSNMYEFASDFNCPAGSKMNPTHKCRVW